MTFGTSLVAGTVCQTFMRNAEGNTPVTLPGVGLIFQAFVLINNSRS
jgi:hypothetical protein